MGGKDSLSRGKGTADGAKLSELPTEKKKGFADWLNLMKPGNEEKDHWVSSDAFLSELIFIPESHTLGYEQLFAFILSCPDFPGLKRLLLSLSLVDKFA